MQYRFSHPHGPVMCLKNGSPTDTKDVMIKEDGNGFFEMRRMKAGVVGKTPRAQWHHWPPFVAGPLYIDGM